MKKKKLKKNQQKIQNQYMDQMVHEYYYTKAIARILDRAAAEGCNVSRMVSMIIAAVQLGEKTTDAELFNKKDLIMMELKEGDDSDRI